MNPYWQMMKSQIKIDISYSAWYWSKTASMVFKLIVIFYFWSAVYENTSAISDITLGQMITYSVMAIIINNYSAGVGALLASQVRTGDVAIELMRPYDVIGKLVSIDLGQKVTTFFRESLPMLLVAYIFLGIGFPPNALYAVLFIVSTLLAILLGSQIDLIIGVLAFYFKYTFGLRMMKGAILALFTGALIPISLFPDWLRFIADVLPFKYMVYVPVSVYMGTLSITDTIIAILIQLGWLVGIMAFIRVIWSVALRKVTINGG
ncbi:ABC transporter permease [Paenibacillus sp. MMS18-CY102]|uniref:ABC transporter permease n=1 Tax=Paenibacillus sp. MMS18-CY102 TaxID=2682849 RepID=UPI001F3E7D9E|nr:ABC-2 family transporter protein [Paenibacillus sp. MMS18-CY102]